MTHSSHVEPEQHHIALLHNVLLAFAAHLAVLLGRLLTASSHEVGVRDRLGTDETPFEIGMDDACRLWRQPAVSDSPGLRLSLARGEVRTQVE